MSDGPSLPDPPAVVTVRAYGSLNDFLSPARRGVPQVRRLAGSPAVKDVIEATGIPHPEVALVVVDGVPVGFEHRLEPGARVALYPAFRSIDLGETMRPGPPSQDPTDARFVVDGHLGRLAAYLRMCGVDTWYRNGADDDELARVAADEDRILLTRDRGLLKRSIVARGAFVRSDRPAEQLVEMLDRFDLADAVRPFARCLRCNAALVPVEVRDALPRVPHRVRFEQVEFRECPVCARLFWRGSHHRRMERLLAWALARVNGDGAIEGAATQPTYSALEPTSRTDSVLAPSRIHQARTDGSPVIGPASASLRDTRM